MHKPEALTPEHARKMFRSGSVGVQHGDMDSFYKGHKSLLDSSLMDRLSDHMPGYSDRKRLAYGYMFANNMYLLHHHPDFPVIRRSMNRFCKDVADTNIDLGDYGVRFEKHFQYSPGADFEGYSLVLRKKWKQGEGPSRPEGEEALGPIVYTLSFRVGYPFEVHYIQGPKYSTLPQEFAKKMGRPPETVLVDSLISKIDEHFKFEPGMRTPKLTFTPYSIDQMKRSGARRTIVEAYCTPSAKEFLGNTTKLRDHPELLRVSNGIFGRRVKQFSKIEWPKTV